MERVLDVRRAGPRSYQVLLRWKGAHDDEWRPMAACSDLTKREAQVLIKCKFPPRSSGCGEARVTGAQRCRGHLRRGCAAASPAGLIGPRRIFRGGGETAVWNPGVLPCLLPGAGARAGAFNLEREQAGVCGGCRFCGSPPRRVTSGDISGRSPRRRSGEGRRRAREGGASWRMRASPNGGVRELSRGGAAPSPQTPPPREGR